MGTACLMNDRTRVLGMKSLIIGPDAARRARLNEAIAGIAPNLDTDIDLTGVDPRDGTRLHHIGADLYVPINMQAFNIPVVETGGRLTIAAIEIQYIGKTDDFVVTHLFVTDNVLGAIPADIDSMMLRQIPVDKYKRMVISSWILRDCGENGTGVPRWMSWAYQSKSGQFRRANLRGATTIDLLYTARIYVAARYGDGDAREMMCSMLGVSRSTAGRWVVKARELGYIDHIDAGNHFGEKDGPNATVE